MSEQDSSSSGVRASDAERDAVVGRLNRAVGEGRLTMDEFSAASDSPTLRAPAATLSRCCATCRPTPGTPCPPPRGTAVVSGGGQGSDTHWNISPIGGIRHRGHWRVPRHTVAIGVLGGVDVDLGEAELAAPEVMITKVSIIGGVSVRVPPGVRVEVSNFSILGGRNVNLGGPLAPNAPVLRIRSFSIIGGVNVRESRKKRNRDAGSWHSPGRPRTGTLTEAG